MAINARMGRRRNLTPRYIINEAMRLAHQFPEANLLRALQLLQEQPHRFCRESKPRHVRCIGRTVEGELCTQWFWSPDVLTCRRCPDCHTAERLGRRESEADKESIHRMFATIVFPKLRVQVRRQGPVFLPPARAQ